MLTFARLVLVRHGQTAGNMAGLSARMSGLTDLPLTDQGVSEARSAARALAREPRPSIIYTSPLARARTTATILAGVLPASISVEPALSEIDCGEADGLPLFEVQRRYPEAWARNLAQTDPDFRWPSGESYREFRARVLGAIRTIAAAHVGERVLVVTHAGVISQIIGSHFGVGPERWELFRPRNCSITELDWYRDTVRVLRFDRVPTEALGPAAVAPAPLA
ncbi:MAG TPA: histidine phosphatase family protein [Polyangiaceae bacterium]|nr:histidine phosphatase family protein [Polyangiaceae bacterium]